MKAHATTPLALEQLYVIFRLEHFVCGLDIGNIQEINRKLRLTTVYHAPSYVEGILNLRGQIVTVIDLRLLLGMPSIAVSRHTRNIVVRVGNEFTGLIVDAVDDIIAIKDSELSSAPPHLSPELREYVTGVLPSQHDLIAILDVEKLVGVH